MSTTVPDLLPEFVPTSFTKIGKVREYLNSPERESYIMAWIAEGGRLTQIAELIGVRYSDLYRVLTTDKRAEFMAARAAHAEIIAEKNLEMADDVEEGRTPADAANAAAKIRNHYQEHTSPDTWGKKSSLDLNVKGITGLHLDAIRQLSDEPLEGEFEEVDEAEDLDGEELL